MENRKNTIKKYFFVLLMSTIGAVSTTQAQTGTIKARNLKTNELKVVKQAFLETSLKDPSSVLLKDVNGVQKSKGDSIEICGQYNAKNGFGGYTGFETFYGMLGDKGQFAIIMTTNGEIADKMCSKRFDPD